MTCTVSLVDVSGLAGGWVRNTRRDDASLDRHPSAHRAPRARSAPAGASRQRTSSFPVPEGSTVAAALTDRRSEEHTSELQSLMRISYAVFCLKKKNTKKK